MYNGDVNHLLQHLTEDLNPKSEEEKIFMEEINNKRNFGMADKVMEFLEKGDHKTYFVIVGTLHLIEKPHIISILQEKGYNVTHVH
ncbi:TraB/GumN family protein [Virgibacillus soli]|uniref:TraB/GumN family protein n=1 Tax=Paracerasibacillus soli TaxID=480284 RepID=A0ABU5CN10_9BACI|nr:TraB/GumN family protein [Virgibacillus soli]MDY0407739.1 TraB/GumN family protein [Virgibacillus soli]